MKILKFKLKNATLENSTNSSNSKPSKISKSLKTPN
jgi:hypothetical protein